MGAEPMRRRNAEMRRDAETGRSQCVRGKATSAVVRSRGARDGERSGGREEIRRDGSGRRGERERERRDQEGGGACASSGYGHDTGQHPSAGESVDGFDGLLPDVVLSIVVGATA